MLNAMRKGVKSLPAKILIVSLIAAFALWGINFSSFQFESQVARVGDTEISAQRFANSLAREQSQLTRRSGQFVSFDMMRAAGLDRRILAGLIRDAAFHEELTALGIEAPDEAVADAIRSNPNLQGPGGQFSNQAYSMLLAQQGFSPAEFEELNRTLLGQQILVETVEAASFAPPGAGARIAAYQGERRSVTTLTLTLDMAPDPGAPDEGALREFYEANEAMFTEPERRWGEYLHLDAVILREKLVPDEAVLRAAYEANIDAYSVAASRIVDQITIPDRAAAEAAMARLVSGEVTFEALGEEFGLSAGDLSLGRVTAGDLPAAAADLVFAETEPGIVGPVELPAGFAVYRINEINEGGAAPFEDVRQQIADRYTADELTVRAPEIANQIEELRAEGLRFAEIAGRLGDDAAVDHGRIEGLARDATLAGGTQAAGILASPQFIGEAFEALDAEERNLVETPGGGYLLVMVERIEPSVLLPLDEVRERAVAARQAAERLKAIEAQGEEIAARLGDDASIWDVGEELNLVANPVEPFTRLSPPADLPAALIDKIFRVANAGGAAAPNGDGTEVIVAQVSAIIPLDPDAMAASSARVEQAFAQSLQRDASEYFARAIQAHHEASVDVTIIDEVFTRLGAVSSQTGQ